MKKKTAKIFMLVLTVGLLCCAFMLTASAEGEAEIITGKCGENTYYTYNPDTDALVFSGEGKIEGGPSEYGVIVFDSLDSCYIIIEDGITEIGEAFFEGMCTAIYIPESVNYIHERAFELFNNKGTNALSLPDAQLYYEGSQEQFGTIAPELYTPTLYFNPTYNYTLNSHEHSFSESVFDGNDALMCEHPWWSECICSCGFTYYSINEPLGYHDWDWSNPKYMHLPCEDYDGDSLVEYAFFCKKCNLYTIEPRPAEPHTFECYLYSDIPPCQLTEERTMTRWSRCAVCGMEYDETEITAVPIECECLEWETTVEATCTKEGEERGTCIHCGSGKTRAIEKAPHVMRDWETKTAATCYSEGEEIRYCSRRRGGAFGSTIVCDYYETRTIPMLPHEMEDWYVEKAATCTEEGVEKRVCKYTNMFLGNCTHYETRPISATGHSLGDWQTVQNATCHNQGLQERRCESCGGQYEQRYTPLAAHADPDDNGLCDTCGTEVSHKDFDGNDYCDYCNKDLDVTFIDIIENFVEDVRDFFDKAFGWFRNLFKF